MWCVVLQPCWRLMLLIWLDWRRGGGLLLMHVLPTLLCRILLLAYLSRRLAVLRALRPPTLVRSGFGAHLPAKARQHA